jgi:hypothetical protein
MRTGSVSEQPYFEELAQIVIYGLNAGKTVEIDGLGTFHPDPRQGFRFEPSGVPQVFVAYASEDMPLAGRLFHDLQEAGFGPWLDARKLMPGQNWPRAIERAIESSDFFVACFSEQSVNKRGGFQAEIRYALDCARSAPLDDIFIVPVRLEPCAVPERIQKEFQYVDLFPDWNRGVRQLVAMMRKEVARRRRRAPR